MLESVLDTEVRSSTGTAPDCESNYIRAISFLCTFSSIFALKAFSFIFFLISGPASEYDLFLLVFVKLSLSFMYLIHYSLFGLTMLLRFIYKCPV